MCAVCLVTSPGIKNTNDTEISLALATSFEKNLLTQHNLSFTLDRDAAGSQITMNPDLVSADPQIGPIGESVTLAVAGKRNRLIVVI